MVEQGQNWLKKANDWKFLIKWAIEHSNAL
jgi:hypothetical protein